MSFTDNLMAFNTQIENAIGEIPQEQILSDPNIYRLVKLLSWSKQAAGATGGGGGSTSPMDIASGINAASDIDTIISELQDIAANTSSGGTTAATISAGIDGSIDINSLINSLNDIFNTQYDGSNTTVTGLVEVNTAVGEPADSAVFNSTDNGSLIGFFKGLLGKLGNASTDNWDTPTLFGLLKSLRTGDVTNLVGIDETLNNGDSIDLAALIPSAATRWVTGYTFIVTGSCKLSLDQGGGGNLASYFFPAAGGIDKVLAHPHISNSNQSLTLTVTEATAPIRITGQLELRRA